MKTWIERKYGRKLIRMLIGGRGGGKNKHFCHCRKANIVRV